MASMKLLHPKNLYIPFIALLIIATVQLALVSRMVAFLHIQKTEIGSYRILVNTTYTVPNNSEIGQEIILLDVLPKKLSVNQGHITNGAAGYGVVLSIACIFASLLLRKEKYQARHKSILLAMTILLSLLVCFIFSAFVYVTAVTYLTIENTIDIDYARSLAASSQVGGGGGAISYAIDSWTPETWYRAVLLLPLDANTMSTIFNAYHEMLVWRYWMQIYQIVAGVVLWWTGMSCWKEWRRRYARSLSGDLVEYRVVQRSDGGK